MFCCYGLVNIDYFGANIIKNLKTYKHFIKKIKKASKLPANLNMYASFLSA